MLDLPGVAEADVELILEKGVLQITADRKLPEDNRKNLYEERSFGKVTRSLSLPELANPDGITASLNDGVLRVTVAKSPEEQPKRVELN